mgnify:CR=1 FL=1
MSDLSDFLRKKQQDYEQEQMNWQNVKEQWQQQVREFMDQINSWLKPLVQEQLLNVQEGEICLDEEHIGSYATSTLEIVIGGERIKIQPVGRLIIGALGRIDISSSKGSYIVLYHEQQGWIYRNAHRREPFTVFNENNFMELIRELA